MAPRKPSRGAASTRRNRQKTGKPGKRGGKRRTSWKKGQSGNAKGRPPLPEDYKEALKILEPRALVVLDEVMGTPGHPRREQAAEYVIDRARGRAKQTTELSGPGGAPIAVREVRTSDERRARMKELEAKAAAVLAGGVMKQREPGSSNPDGSD